MKTSIANKNGTLQYYSKLNCQVSHRMLFCNLTDVARATAVDQDTCQETLENLVKAFQNVMDLHSKVSINFILLYENFHRKLLNKYLLRVAKYKCGKFSNIFT